MSEEETEICDRCAGRPYTPTSHTLCRTCWKGREDT